MSAAGAAAAPAAPAYAALAARWRRVAALGDAMAMLSWDRQAMMPPGGAAARADTLAELAVLRHEAVTAPEIADLASRAGEEPLDPWPAANLREIRRLRLHAAAVPPDLVAARSRAASACEMAWREARPADDFAAVAEPFARLLALVREAAAAKADALGKTPYDALLDAYEPGGDSARIDATFARLEPALAALLPEILERQARRPADPPPPPVPVERQRALGRRVAAALGFDFAHGRLDESAHPFTGGAPDDVRLTTRYDEADWTSALMGTVHETGHALYERGLPPDWRGQPAGGARGMTLHESQSLLVEMQVGRSRPFLEFLAPLLREAFGARGPEWEPEALRRRATRVERGLVRVEADEATYPFHVVMRYRLERALLSGDLAPADLPGAWGEAMEAALGVRPPGDRLGCLQDIHWYDGAFGYFPTYTLGALAAAQLFAAARRAVADMDANIAAGDFAPLLGWLRENVHAWGSFLDTDALLARATGAPLSEAAFLAHIRRRYIEEEEA